MQRWLAVVLLSVLLVFAGDRTRLKFEITNKDGKPVDRAAVIVKFLEGHNLMKLGKRDVKQWELRTNQMGQVSLPSIPQGKIQVQVIAKGYQTYGGVIDIDKEDQLVPITLNPPQTQYSAH